MEKGKDSDLIQWHPAFQAALHLEFLEYDDILEYQFEFPLTRKPLQIDVLIIKKKKDVKIDKAIASFFRTYNILEYKSPDDILSINDYRKIQSYLLLYQTIQEKNDPNVNDISITLLCYHYPRKLAKFLKEEFNLEIEKQDEGIYIIKNDRFPTQIVLIPELSRENARTINLLIKDDLDKEQILDFIQSFDENEHDNEVELVLDILSKVNPDKLMEVYDMPVQLSEKGWQHFVSAVNKCPLLDDWREETRLEAEARGEAKKERELNIEHAKRMKDEGVDIPLISRVTGLSAEEIEKL